MRGRKRKLAWWRPEPAKVWTEELKATAARKVAKVVQDLCAACPTDDRRVLRMYEDAVVANLERYLRMMQRRRPDLAKEHLEAADALIRAVPGAILKLRRTLPIEFRYRGKTYPVQANLFAPVGDAARAALVMIGGVTEEGWEIRCRNQLVSPDLHLHQLKVKPGESLTLAFPD